MAIKKTFGGDSPLRQGLGSTTVDRDVFWKSDRVFRFFPSGGLYRRRESVRSGPGGPHHRAAQPGPRPLVVRPPPGSFPSPVRFSRIFGKFLDVWLLFRPISRIFPV
jgi:hypothetical protein